MTAKGVKSGDAITTPLVYGREGDQYVIVASKGGSPKHPAWFGNIKANPEVEVEVANANGTETFKARAHVVDNRAERDRLYEEMSKIWPSFKDYETKTERVIPVVILERERA
jgi:deazaflavin-dependent oxidoreductase (nitroreductase family)